MRIFTQFIHVYCICCNHCKLQSIERMNAVLNTCYLTDIVYPFFTVTRSINQLLSQSPLTELPVSFTPTSALPLVVTRIVSFRRWILACMPSGMFQMASMLLQTLTVHYFDIKRIQLVFTSPVQTLALCSFKSSSL